MPTKNAKVVKLPNGKYAITRKRLFLPREYRWLTTGNTFYWERHGTRYFRQICMGSLQWANDVAVHLGIAPHTEDENIDTELKTKPPTFIKFPVHYDHVNQNVVDAEFNFICSVYDIREDYMSKLSQEQDELGEYLVDLLNKAQ